MKSSFSIECKYGSDIRLWQKDVVSQYPNEEGRIENVVCIETLTGSPSMLTDDELTALLLHLSKHVGLNKMITILKKENSVIDKGNI